MLRATLILAEAVSKQRGPAPAYRERLDLFFCFRCRLLQLRLGLAQLALQGGPGSLQGCQLGLALLQGELQLGELALQFQFLLLML